MSTEQKLTITLHFYWDMKGRVVCRAIYVRSAFSTSFFQIIDLFFEYSFRNWILSLVAGVDDSGFGANSLYSLYIISVYLTQSGMNHVKEVSNLLVSVAEF